MEERDRVLTYIADANKTDNSLFEFIINEINPLLGQGWEVGCINIIPAKKFQNSQLKVHLSSIAPAQE